MPLYLSPYEGKGTRDNPFRPVGTDQPGWSAIDLRADGGASLDGAGFPYALLWLPNGSVEEASFIKLADNQDELLAVSSRQQLGSKSILDLSHALTISDALEELLLRPKANGWNPLSPVNGIYEAWLGSEAGKIRWIAKASRALGGGAITDNFNRADETPVKSPWTAYPGTAGGPVNLSSNGLQKITTAGDSFYYYNNPDGWGADQSSELTDTVGVTQSDWGPAVRIGSNGFSGYFYSQYTGVATQRVTKCVAGTFTTVENALGVTTIGQPYKIEAIGSTINYYDNGTPDANSPGTDTALVSGGAGPGFQLFALGGSLDNFTGTGESAASMISSAARFGFSPARAPWKRQRLHPSQPARSDADLNLPPVIDEQISASRSRFGWSPSRRPMSRRNLRASQQDVSISVTTSIDLAGTVSISLVTTGDLSTAIALAGTSTISLLTVGALSTSIALAGASTISLTTAGDLSTAIRFAAAATISITTTGALSTTITLAGAAAISLTTTGALSTAIRLAGAAAISITTTGDLSVGSGLNAAVSMSLTASASLSTAIRLAGAASISLVTTGALSTAIRFAGAASISLMCTGDLKTGVPVVNLIETRIGATPRLVLQWPASRTIAERMPSTRALHETISV